MNPVHANVYGAGERHKSRHCVFCGKAGPRTMVAGGWAHKRCIPKPLKRDKTEEVST